MGKYGLTGDMTEGFRVLQLAVNERNFQEGLLTTLPRSGLLEPLTPADSVTAAAEFPLAVTTQDWRDEPLRSRTSDKRKRMA